MRLAGVRPARSAKAKAGCLLGVFVFTPRAGWVPSGPAELFAIVLVIFIALFAARAATDAALLAVDFHCRAAALVAARGRTALLAKARAGRAANRVVAVARLQLRGGVEGQVECSWWHASHCSVCWQWQCHALCHAGKPHWLPHCLSTHSVLVWPRIHPSRHNTSQTQRTAQPFPSSLQVFFESPPAQQENAVQPFMLHTPDTHLQTQGNGGAAGASGTCYMCRWAG